MSCWEVGSGNHPGERRVDRTAEVKPRPGPSVLGEPDFSFGLFGLNKQARLGSTQWQGDPTALDVAGDL